jgi:hypothetical protein
MSGEAVPVLNDPQFGVTSILRPYTGYTTRYQGQSVTRPIMVTEGGVPFDGRAGLPGYNAGLLRGLPVPFGARVSIWLPIIPSPGIGFGDILPYDWCIGWRQRNVFDYRNQRIPFHFPMQNLQGNNEFLIPMAAQGSIMQYSDVVLGLAVDNVTQYPLVQAGDMVSEKFRVTDGAGAGASSPGTLFPNIPIAPVALGAPATFAQQRVGLINNLFPSYVVHELQAQGDELLIGFIRPATDGAGVTWDFTTSDLGVLRFFEGSPDIGVMINIGVAT